MPYSGDNRARYPGACASSTVSAPRRAAAAWACCEADRPGSIRVVTTSARAISSILTTKARGCFRFGRCATAAHASNCQRIITSSTETGGISFRPIRTPFCTKAKVARRRVAVCRPGVVNRATAARIHFTNSPPDKPPGPGGDGGAAFQSRRPHQFTKRGGRQTVVPVSQAKQSAKTLFAMLPNVGAQSVGLRPIHEGPLKARHLSAPSVVVAAVRSPQ